ncbi:hypothetical protein LOK49_LG06G01785 [Camellia lanceoleosa]|uniref:Uncharacterized protein n=1 Tax=Camellia lanceoleosa TaxID=1840588 RepID=A0ACC0HHT7_9ERIC|nr:hypothetical protein LOK49_LG06G01785 [Camellia lanceoleosa]
MVNFLDLLGHMPNLKVLVFNRNKGHKNLELCLWSGEPESVPKCLSLCLEAIEFSGFTGSKGEMKLVRSASCVCGVGNQRVCPNVHHSAEAIEFSGFARSKGK